MTMDQRERQGTGRGRIRPRVTAFAVGGVLAAASALAFPITGSAASKTIFVHPGDSIQAAVDKAKPGDTVKVLAGTYHQQVNISTDDITLKGEGPSKTIIMPPAIPGGNCDAAEGPTGICVGVAPIVEDSTVNRVVEGVTIKSLTVMGFAGSGMFLFGTDEGTVENVHASNDGVYGIFFNSSTHGVIEDNLVTGNAEAGIYYGHSAVGGALIEDNTALNNQFGIFMRDASNGKARDNTSKNNCVGMFVLDTGFGNANWLLKDNDVDTNNMFCPGREGRPSLGGIGIFVFGFAPPGPANINLVKNDVEGNSAGNNPSKASGGIVLVGTQSANVTSNDLDHNAPDILWDGTGTVTFTKNDCDASIPPGLC